jgi:hypothetical protein
MQAREKIRPWNIVRACSCEHHPAIDERLVTLWPVVVVAVVVSARMTGNSKHLSGGKRTQAWIPATAASVRAGFEAHARNFGEGHRRRVVGECVPVSLEVDMGMDSHRLRRERYRPAGGEQPPVADEGVAAAEEVHIRRLDVRKRLRRMSTVKAPAVIPMTRDVRCAIMVVATKKEDLAIPGYGRHECGMDGDDVFG